MRVLHRHVSIHAPVWGAKSNTGLPFSNFEFQSTHPCGVRSGKFCHVELMIVSIHAPVWGAKFYIDPADFAKAVSIHAPVWGANWRVAFVFQKPSFNPRTRVGCEKIIISVSVVLPCFNPRTRVGCEFYITPTGVCQCVFQSTHPCGVRILPEF